MKKHYSLFICVIFIVTYLPAFAQNIVVNGNAINQGGNCYQLTAAQSNQAGSVWSQNKVTLHQNLEIRANLNFGANDNGADGIAFVFQGICNGIGSFGEGLGYEGISPSVAVEFDTWTNSQYNDPIQDHIAIQKNGNLTHNSPDMLSSTVSILPNIEDGLEHEVIIKWDADQHSLTVYFDGVLQSSYTGNIVADIFNDNAEVFWGFTGATGTAFSNQKVCILSVEATEAQIPYVVTPVSCSGNTDGAIDFATLSGATFMWNTGAQTENLYGLSAGIYALTVTDSEGCASIYTIQVPVVPDTTPPTALCRNSFLSLGANGSAILAMPSVNNNSFDNCAIASLSINSLLFECNDLGPNIVILTVTDFSGNSSTCESTVTVRDLIPPTISCPATAAVCGNDLNTAITGLATATDNCDVSNITFTDNHTNFSCDFEGTVVRTWKATDQSNNTATCTQTIQVSRDITPPVCLNFPGDYIASCGENLSAIPLLEVSDNCDPAPTVTIDSTGSTIGADACSLFSYPVVRIFTIADRCGNYQTYTQTITVVDETPPTILCPTSVAVACLDINNLAITGAPFADDSCDPAPSLIYSDVQSNDCDPTCLIERTWKATDACGNVSTCVQTITTSGSSGFHEALNTDLSGDGIPDPLVLGYSFHTFTISAEDVDCINGWVPSAGAVPTALPRARTVVGADCRPGSIRLDADGHFVNPLLAEGLMLALKLRLDPEFGQKPLSEFNCAIHPVLLQYMPPNPVANDLMRLVNLGLGNILGPIHLPHILATLRCLNSNYTFCNDSGSGNALAIPSNKLQPLIHEASIKTANDWSVFPNPAQHELTVAANESAINQDVTLRLVNASGQIVYWQTHESGELLRVDVSELPEGLYVLEIQCSGEDVLFKKIIINR